MRKIKISSIVITVLVLVGISCCVVAAQVNTGDFIITVPATGYGTDSSEAATDNKQFGSTAAGMRIEDSDSGSGYCYANVWNPLSKVYICEDSVFDSGMLYSVLIYYKPDWIYTTPSDLELAIRRDSAKANITLSGFWTANAEY